jgi:hypothetical protein
MARKRRRHLRPLPSLVFAAALVFALAPAALAAAPANDERSGAVAITTLPYATTLDTSEATASAGDPVCWDAPQFAATVWYSFTAPATETVIIDHSASDYSPRNRVWDTSDETFILSCYDSNPMVSLEVEAGHTYMMMFGDPDTTDGVGGYLSFTVTAYTPMPAEPVVTVDITGVQLVAGELLVSGTTSIAGDYDSTTMDVSARQKGGKNPPAGYLSQPGLTGTWTVTVLHDPTTGAWMAGRNVTVSVRYMYEWGGGYSNLTRYETLTVRLPSVPKK